MADGTLCHPPFALCHLASALTDYELEVVPDPDSELDFAELRATSLAEEILLICLVEERPVRPVEVHGEAEREGFEADAVGRARIDQADPSILRAGLTTMPPGVVSAGNVSDLLSQALKFCLSSPAPPMLAKNTPRMPPRMPMGVAIALISGKRSSALA